MIDSLIFDSDCCNGPDYSSIPENHVVGYYVLGPHRSKYWHHDEPHGSEGHWDNDYRPHIDFVGPGDFPVIVYFRDCDPRNY